MTHKRDLVVALSRMSFLSCGQKILLLNNLDNLSMVALLSIEELKKLSGKNLDKTQWNPDLLLKQVEKDMDRDNWMSAEEALQYGIIDEIIK